MPEAIFACNPPMFFSVSICDERTFTIANSEATKNAFRITKPIVINMSKAINNNLFSDYKVKQKNEKIKSVCITIMFICVV